MFVLVLLFRCARVFSESEQTGQTQQTFFGTHCFFVVGACLLRDFTSMQESFTNVSLDGHW